MELKQRAPSFNIAALVISIWFVFALLTSLAQDNFLFASLNVELLIFCFIISFIIGALFCGYQPNMTDIYNAKRLSPLGRKIQLYMVAFYLFSVLFVVGRRWFYETYLGVPLERVQIYSPDRELDGPYIAILYVAILYLKSFSALFSQFLLVRGVLKQKFLLPAFISGIVLIDAYLFSAKGLLIELAFLFFVTFLFSDKRRFAPGFPSHWVLFLCAVIAAIVVFYFISFSRGQMRLNDFANYIFIGPILLTNIVESGYEFAPAITGLGNVSLLISGYEYFITVIFRSMGVQIQTLGYDWVKMMSEPLVISQSSSSFSPSSTFFTILAEPFLAFGSFGVVLLGGALGFILPKLEGNYRCVQCDLSLFWCIYLSKIVVFGIFSSPLYSVSFWLILIFVSLFYNLLFQNTEVLVTKS